MKICQENLNLVKIRQKHFALYMKTYICFIVAEGHTFIIKAPFDFH